MSAKETSGGVSQKSKKISQGFDGNSRAGSVSVSMIDVPKLFLHPSERDAAPEFDLKTFLGGLPFQELLKMDEKELAKHLSDVDAVALLNAVQEVTRDLTKMKLENLVLTDFLHKNDPKLLVGLRTRRATASASRRSIPSSYEHVTAGGTTTRVSSRPSVVTAQSAFTTTSSMSTSMQRKQTVEYRLNYRTKADIAEKTANDIEKRIEDAERKAIQRIRTLNVHIEELRYTIKELQETAKNFELNFLKNERDLTFLETAPEREVERKLRKFVDNWLKNARSLLGIMHLRITSLREACVQHRNDLMAKEELSDHLNKIDFDQLVIERDGIFAEFEEKQNTYHNLQSVTGKASLAMGEEKNSLARLENESQRIKNQVADIIKTIEFLEKDVKLIDSENKKDLKVLSRLQEEVEQFKAPSVNEYIERKHELLSLEKEEKVLERKIQISSMKLNHILKRCKRRDDVESYV